MRKAPTPRVEFDLDKIKHNARQLKKLYGSKGINITGVVKGVGANLAIAQALVHSGFTSLADSKIVRLKKLKKAGIQATYILLRSPALSEVGQVIQYADISMNTEIEVIRALSAEAERRNKKHSIILMVEMGDLREGILCQEAPAFIEEVLKYPGVKIVGIGTNLACFGGVIPTKHKMDQFSTFVQEMKQQFNLDLSYVSGGNSANYDWLTKINNPGLINHIRLGESIFLGRETIYRQQIPGLFTDAFRLIAEVIESKTKPSLPDGKIGQNAFGQTLVFKDQGLMRRALIGIGREDVNVQGLTPLYPIEILGSSSDHIILDCKNLSILPGDEIAFSLNYGALLSVMTSPYIYKKALSSSHKRLKSGTKTPA